MREQVAGGLFNKGFTLGTLGKSEEAIAVYDEIDRRFGKDEAPAVREQVAKGLVYKGVTLGTLGKSEEEIAVYDEIDRRFGKDEAPAVREQVVKGLVGKGFRLGALGKSEEAIAVYDEIDRRFGKDEAPAVREQVARALNGAAFRRILSAKKIWTDGHSRIALLDNAIASLERVAENCADDMRAMVFGNLGYASYLRDNKIAAVESTKKCLQLGGEELLAGQRADAKLHRVEPEDTDYEKLLEQLWIELHPAKT